MPILVFLVKNGLIRYLEFLSMHFFNWIHHRDFPVLCNFDIKSAVPGIVSYHIRICGKKATPKLRTLIRQPSLISNSEKETLQQFLYWLYTFWYDKRQYTDIKVAQYRKIMMMNSIVKVHRQGHYCNTYNYFTYNNFNYNDSNYGTKYGWHY